MMEQTETSVAGFHVETAPRKKVRAPSRIFARKKSASNSKTWPALLLILPSVVAVAVCVYGFIGWTGVVSFTSSGISPRFDVFSFKAYEHLFANPRWIQALKNLGMFSALFIPASLGLGIFTAILLDRSPKAGGFFRTFFLFPMALSTIVVGVAWKWILSPRVEGDFDWIARPETVVYTIVIAAIWQSSGFVMALFFSGLKGLSPEVRQAAQLDGASVGVLYRKILLPQLKPVFLSAFVVLMNNTIKTFDLVLAMTAGGPGYASEFPANFMYVYSFQRNQLAIGAASAVILFATCLVVILPQFKRQKS